MDNFQNQIEMELIQQQANDNTFDYTEGEEYEKCAELVKLKNKLWS